MQHQFCPTGFDTLYLLQDTETVRPRALPRAAPDHPPPAAYLDSVLDAGSFCFNDIHYCHTLCACAATAHYNFLRWAF